MWFRPQQSETNAIREISTVGAPDRLPSLEFPRAWLLPVTTALCLVGAAAAAANWWFKRGLARDSVGETRLGLALAFVLHAAVYGQ